MKKGGRLLITLLGCSLPQNWGGSETKRTVTCGWCSKLRLMTGVHLALCLDKFRSSRSHIVRQRVQTSSRWYGVVVRRFGCHLRCRPRHINERTFELSTDLTCIAPLHGGPFSGTGLELVTSQPRSDTLTTRLPRPPDKAHSLHVNLEG
ncbi:hypothetical protein TNCV_2486861 [Trichonephila clavipes]|uniref:Secreted protein n=1 Tax=Trichonephila clavipes TaxID=2585209 RepID=A0A8X6W084_TRICX|nr:hypothetical protein TNCV_2486861 [Trichonephila clavipes]